MKVYGILLYDPKLSDRTSNDPWNHQVRAVVAAKSRAEAARLLKVTTHHLKTYGGETANDEECEVALGEVGVVFFRGDGERKGGWQKS